MDYRFAMPDDAAVLAQMNQCLIEDERHRNAMSLDELIERMRRWLGAEYQAVMFYDQQQLVGYVLFKVEPEWVYLRQFFIRRDRRRQGHGRAAIEWLIANIWAEWRRVRLDVLVNNSAGIEFWKSLGFTEYCLTMEREC